MESEAVSVLFCNHIRNKEQSMDFTRRTCSEVGENCPVGRKGDGIGFLGFIRYNQHRLPGQGHNGQRDLLYRIWRIKKYSSTKTISHLRLLCRPSQNVFFRRVKKVSSSLGQIYRSKSTQNLSAKYNVIRIGPPSYILVAVMTLLRWHAIDVKEKTHTHAQMSDDMCRKRNPKDKLLSCWQHLTRGKEVMSLKMIHCEIMKLM